VVERELRSRLRNHLDAFGAKAPDKMKHFPVFSVVIPTYNRAGFILRTLESVWRQTYPHFEIIVVDNCSTDNTATLLEPHIDAQRIRFIKHDRNLERARSRNTGMSAATGDFVTLLDSDDLMYPTNLEDAAAFSQANPESRCFHNLFEFINRSHEVVYRPRFPNLHNQVKAIAQGNFMACVGNFIHREIYTRYRFNTDPEIIGGEDWDFWLRVLADYKVSRIPKINNGVLQHEGRSVNNQDINTMGKGLEKVRLNIVSDPHLAAVYGPYVKCIEASSNIYLAILANGGGLHRLALSHLFHAAERDPSVVMSRRFIKISQVAIVGLLRGQRTREVQNQVESISERP